MPQSNHDRQEPSSNVKDAHFWQEHIKQYQSSQLSKAAYAREHQLVHHQFAYWCRKMDKQQKPSQQASPDFIPVKLARAEQPISSSVLCTLELSDGHKILVHQESVLPYLLEKIR